MKVLLYIKRSVQDKDGFSPLMGRISVRGKVNSIAQFACKFKIDVRLWNATAQRCTGKSKAATMANREIERLLLLLQKRFNELTDIKDVVKAEEVRNVFQGLAETQDTIMKLYADVPALSTLNSRLCGATSTCSFSRAPTNNGICGGLQPSCSGARKKTALKIRGDTA